MTVDSLGHGWLTSTFCANAGCVEVQLRPDGNVAVRDSKERGRPALLFTGEEWRAFLAGARAGEFTAP